MQPFLILFSYLFGNFLEYCSIIWSLFRICDCFALGTVKREFNRSSFLKKEFCRCRLSFSSSHSQSPLPASSDIISPMLLVPHVVRIFLRLTLRNSTVNFSTRCRDSFDVFLFLFLRLGGTFRITLWVASHRNVDSVSR